VKVLVALPVVLPLLAAGLSLALHRWSAFQRTLTVAVLSLSLAASIAVLVAVDRDGTFATVAGGWPAPVGITLVADLFSAMMLVVSTAMVLGVLLYAIGSPGTDDHQLFFHPVYLVLSAGVAASFVTGDLFNLFVSFEVMLTASYVLLTMGASRDRVRSGMTYIVISVVASTLFVTAVGLVYAATGTVNLAELSVRLAELPSGVRASLGLLLLVVFGIKAAIFPLFFWLPDAYPAAPTPVTAIFAGLLTKVGVYAIIRVQTLLFSDGDGASTVLLWIAAATMLAGVLGAIAQDDVKRILSFHIVSQIGYMVFGVALFTVAGTAAAIFYIAHHIIVKTALFLVSGLIEQRHGTAALRDLGGMMRTAPWIAVLFAVPALSLAGLPPFSGFLAKVGIVRAGAASDQYALVAVSLAVSLLTLYSMTKIWIGAFWGDPEAPRVADPPVGEPQRVPRLMTAATGSVVVLSLAVAAGAGPLYALSERAGHAVMDRPGYVEAVLEP
jgi:multicomponent Na+:H+ antiporter subunit D